MKKGIGFTVKRGTKIMSLLVACIFMLALVLSGCGGTASGGAAPSASAAASAQAETSQAPADTKTADAGKATTVDFWIQWGGDFQKDYQKYVVDVFEKQNPNIKVKVTFVETTGQTQASDKLLTAIAGGTGPDVAQFDRFLIGSWAAKDSLTDLTSMAAADGVKAEDYYPALWKEGVYKGKVYCLPWGTDNRAMFYNKDLMKQAGLDPEKPPKTIPELDAAAEKIFKKGSNGKYSQIGFIPWMNQGFLYTQGWNFGGQWEKDGQLTPNDPQIVKALEWMAGYGKKYNIENLTSFSNAMGQTGMNPFWTGKVGFVFDGNWILGDLKKFKVNFAWGVAPMPSADGNPQVTWAGGWSYVIPKGAKHLNEGWKFLKFVGGKEGTLLWANRPLPTKEITAMPAVNDETKISDDPNLKVFVDLMPKAFTRPVTPVGALLWNEALRVTDLAVNGKGEPKQLLDEVKKNCDAELAKIK